MAAPTGLAATAAAAAAAATCPAYPWPHDGAQRGGKKVFMQSDCAACHSMLPYAIVREAAEEVGLPKAAEIVVVAAVEEAPLAARPDHGGGGAFMPDLTTLVANVQEGIGHNLYTSGGVVAAATPRMLADGAAVCEELKKKMVWLQFVQPYMRTFQAA